MHETGDTNFTQHYLHSSSHLVINTSALKTVTLLTVKLSMVTVCYMLTAVLSEPFICYTCVNVQVTLLKTA